MVLPVWVRERVITEDVVANVFELLLAGVVVRSITALLQVAAAGALTGRLVAGGFGFPIAY